MNLKFIKNERDSANESVLIEQKGQSRIDRVAQSGVGKSSLWGLAEVGWTAGPVTFFAAEAGYYIGFGRWLPKENLIFFVAYTVFMGLVAVMVKFIYNATKGQALDEAKRELLLVVGMLPDVVISIRDLSLSRMDVESRRFESARILLQKSDLGPEWLSLAVNSIIDSPVIARAVEDIEIYWRAGMHSRIADINHELANEIEIALGQLEPDHPRLARLLEQRLLGNKNTLRSGVEREPFFIERIFSAIEEDDEDIMGLSDVEEILILAFELLSGRRIPMLTVSCVGSSQLAKATDRLEHERSKYRIARARGYSQLLALANYLSDHDLLDYSTVAQRLPSKDLMAICIETIDSLSDEIVEEVAAVGRRELVDTRGLTIKSNIFIKALELYKQAYLASDKLESEHANFVKDIADWQRVNKKYADSKTTVSITGQKGLRIEEHQIYLSDSDKLAVIKQIVSHFADNSIVMKSTIRRIDSRFRDKLNQQVRASKQLAIDVALALEPYLKLSLPEVQRAIYSSNAVDMGTFEPGLSSTTKVGWGESVSKEIRKNMSLASGQLAQAIHRYYGIRLGTKELNHLHDIYGLNKKHVIDYYEKNEEGTQSSNVFIPREPMRIPPIAYQWRKTLIQYRQLSET